MPRRWSKLQHRLQEIFAPNIRLQFHCAIYRIPGHVDTVCPRYFLMLNSEIIWDWPRNYTEGLSHEEMYLVYRSSASSLSDLIAEYLNADWETAIALKDEWGIADILRAVDRRIGRRQWDGLLENINPKVSNAVGKIISSRKISRKSQIENEIIGKEGDGRKLL